MKRRPTEFIRALLVASFLVWHLVVQAAPELKTSINQVSFKKNGVQTGTDSRAEISTDGGTVRVGANSSVGIRGEEKTLDLQRGVVMVSTAKKGFSRQSLTVETDQITATTNATMIISYQPRRYIKIACTGGKVTVKLKSLANESVTIRAGQMLVINCLENVLPGAVSVDMNQLMATSPLFAPNLRIPQQGGAPGPPQGGQGGRQGPPPPGGGNNQNATPPPPPPRGARLPGQRPRPINAPGRRQGGSQAPPPPPP